MRLLQIVTTPLSFRLLRGQARFLAARGFEMHAIASPGDLADAYAAAEPVKVEGVPMTRSMTPFRDVRALVALCGRVRRIRPDVVQASTPKAGLLGTLAAWIARVPVRIYQVRGLPLLTATGAQRRILWLTERIACAASTHVLCVSPSMRAALIEQGLCSPAKAHVVLAGSSNGVDTARFNPDTVGSAAQLRIREGAGIPADALVVGFVGRLVRDKGIVELWEAWQRLRVEYPSSHLLIVGPFERGDAVPEEVVNGLEADDRVHMTGLEWDTPPRYAAMDVFCLPSYREGFPNVALEAAAMGLPIVATQIPGTVDAVEHGVTGLLVAPGESGPLHDALGRYLQDASLRKQHATAGRQRVSLLFRQERIWEALHDFYVGLHRASVAASRKTMYVKFGKRALDVAGAALLLVLLSPVLALLALLVRTKLGSPVIFRQRRPGLDGHPFQLMKFRTMTDDRDAFGALRPDADRLTRFGRLLRASSLDELPELWNVLKGDMSLVGPRPLLMQYLARYTPEQARRHEARPGITGLAQVKGRNAIAWEDKFRLDVEYVQNCSFGLDLIILFQTIWQVAARRGVSAPGHATAEEFMGSAVR